MILLLYSVIGGFLLPVPAKPILNESIRNLYFHVPMWFGMIALFIASFIYSIRYLRADSNQSLKGGLNADTLTNKKDLADIAAVEYANAGILFGILGMATGMLWARYTWGEWWSGDVKQNASAILLLMYFAYAVLRGSIADNKQKAKVSAVYNIFAAACIVPLLFVLPRMTASLHPGNGGNPGFNAYDLDSQMRLVFYPAVLAWILAGFWLANQRIGLKRLELKLTENV